MRKSLPLKKQRARNNMGKDTREKVCRTCKRFVAEPKCPICNQSNFSTRWKGLVLINDTNSEIAKGIGVKLPGKYCLFVR